MMTHYESCYGWPNRVIYSHVKEMAIMQLHITLETTPKSSTSIFERRLAMHYHGYDPKVLLSHV